MAQAKTPDRQAEPASSTPERLGALYSATVGGPAKAGVDIISLLVSIVLPLIQGCLNKGGTPASVAAMMKERPVLARLAVRREMRQAHVLGHANAEAIYQTIVEAGNQATAKDVSDFLTENTL
jgi:hypothetical protein